MPTEPADKSYQQITDEIMEAVRTAIRGTHWDSPDSSMMTEICVIWGWKQFQDVVEGDNDGIGVMFSGSSWSARGLMEYADTFIGTKQELSVQEAIGGPGACEEDDD